jgi:predicted transcriptional regulator
MAQILSWDEKRPPVGRRSAFEIRMAILKVIAEGSARPTHIMYRSNTSWNVLRKNLQASISCGFIVQIGQQAREEYRITERGDQVLRDYAALVSKSGQIEISH